MKLILPLLLAITSLNASAAIYCNGIVNATYKWHTMTKLSMQIRMGNGTLTPWISLPTKSDEAMALIALTTGESVVLYWSADDVTVCANGWSDNRLLEGYFALAG